MNNRKRGIDSLLSEAVRCLRKRLVLKALEEALCRGVLVQDCAMEGPNYLHVVTAEAIRALLRDILSRRFEDLPRYINEPEPPIDRLGTKFAIMEALNQAIGAKNRVMGRAGAKVLYGYRVNRDQALMEVVAAACSEVDGSHGAEDGCQARHLHKQRREEAVKSELKKFAALPGGGISSLSSSDLDASIHHTTDHLALLNAQKRGPISGTCCICRGEQVRSMAVLQPCGMMCLCTQCARAYYMQGPSHPQPGRIKEGQECPLCKVPITGITPQVYA